MEEVGKSKVAAENGIYKTIQCRWIYLVPIFFAQPVLETCLRKANMMPKSGPLKRVVDVAAVGLGLWMAMPLCCGYFPQYEKIKLDDLEEDVRKNVTTDQNFLVYNKGV